MTEIEESEKGLRWVPAASAIAREAGARLREFFAQGVETEYKGDVDLVTVADRTAEKLIRTRLGETFPEYGIYGEEGTRERLDGRFRWYVDPLDGTTNFAHGFPHFCVSMGLEERTPELMPEQDGTLVAAVIYDPMRDELYTAEKGHGAFLNDKLIHVSSAAELAEALVATGFPSRKRHETPNIHFYHEFTFALARGAAGGFSGARSGLCGGRPAGRFLGVQPESLGYGGGNSAGRGSGRRGDKFLRRKIFAR